MAVDYHVLHYFPVWCAAVGVKHAVICSGSRSAPLALSFSGYPEITCHFAIDERSAGYMALGMSQETQSPVAIIITSGTAVANLYPAVAEAYYSHTPLIILSADRPQEAAYQYEGQSMFQQELFGQHVLDFVQCCDTTHPHALNWLQARFTESISKLLGTRKGPVHFNFPFEEPFYPTKQTPYPEIIFNFPVRNSESVSSINPPEFIGRKNILMVLGRMGATPELIDWAVKHRVPVVTDITCGAQLPEEIQIFSYEMFLRDGGISLPQPEFIISSGRGLVSKILKNYIKSQTEAIHIYVSTGGEMNEPTGSAKLIISQEQFLNQYSQVSTQPSFLESWKKTEIQATLTLSNYINEAPFSEMKAMNLVFRSIPENYKVHTGNSMAVRWAQIFYNHRSVRCNRGVSGIDGATSSFIGAAMVNHEPHLLVTGDVSFFYDLNALWQEKLPENIKIIVLNNHGGGIFRLIDGPRELPQREEVFVMPRKRAVDLTAASLGMSYLKAGNESELSDAMGKLFASNGPTVLEIDTNPEINGRVFELYRKIKVV